MLAKALTTQGRRHTAGRTGVYAERIDAACLAVGGIKKRSGKAAKRGMAALRTVSRLGEPPADTIWTMAGPLRVAWARPV